MDNFMKNQDNYNWVFDILPATLEDLKEEDENRNYTLKIMGKDNANYSKELLENWMESCNVYDPTNLLNFLRKSKKERKLISIEIQREDQYLGEGMIIFCPLHSSIEIPDIGVVSPEREMITVYTYDYSKIGRNDPRYGEYHFE